MLARIAIITGAVVLAALNTQGQDWAKARLEKSPQKLLWSRVSLSADKHPKLVLTLTVFTLSLDRTWLIV